MDMIKRLNESAQYIRSEIKTEPKIAIILGSGLGSLVNKIENQVVLDYSQIPNFPLTTVEGHAGLLVCGTLGGKQVIALKGRFHYYEGYEVEQVVYATRVLKLMGIDKLIVTNAAGAINKELKPGDLMAITDHIGLFAPSPLRGKNFEEFGVRFPDMSKPYDHELIDILINSAKENGINIKEGIYAFSQGPMFETPAEIRLLRAIGADAVGMSTVPEVITAVHSGIRVLGISCMTNMAAGILDQPLGHAEVLETTKAIEKDFVGLVQKTIENMK